MLLQCGFLANSPGEPACSNDISSSIPVPVHPSLPLSKAYPGGWGFGVAATDEKTLYIWGVNAATMLAKSGSGDDGADPTNLEIVANDVHAAAAGFDHCVLVQNGKLSIFGPQYKPSDGGLFTLIDLPAPVSAVAAGEHHTLILTANGDVYSLGFNREGQLGVPAAGQEFTTTPVLVLGPSTGLSVPIAAIAAGARHSVALSSTGELFAWGCSLHGQCGTGVVTPSVPQPTSMTALGPIKFVGIGAGMSHTLALSESGDVYSWGSNVEGQLGHGSTVGSLKPGLVESLGAEDDPVVKVDAGGRHSVALTKSGVAYTWGWGAFGQLGSGGVENATAPHQVVVQGGKKVADVVAGWWHTVFVTS